RSRTHLHEDEVVIDVGHALTSAWEPARTPRWQTHDVADDAFATLERSGTEVEVEVDRAGPTSVVTLPRHRSTSTRMNSRSITRCTCSRRVVVSEPATHDGASTT